MNLFTERARNSRLIPYIEIVEPNSEECPSLALPLEGNIKIQNYLLNENICAYAPIGDAVPGKRNFVTRYDVCANIAPPRAKILELLRPEDPGRDALEAIVRAAPRRGLTRPLDDDTRRFLQRALQSPNPLFSAGAPVDLQIKNSDEGESKEGTESQSASALQSLADELREAEEEGHSGGIRRELLREFRKRSSVVKDTVERDRLGRLALSVEEDEQHEDGELTATSRRLDVLLAESRDLHDELAEIHEDLQAQCARACRCAASARALTAEARTLRYLDDVVALLRGDVAAAVRARAWPFAIGRRHPARNYII